MFRSTIAVALSGLVLLAGCTTVVSPNHRGVGVAVYAPVAPPPLKVVVKPARPSARHIWVGGYWHWNGNKYVWRSGKWTLGPKGKSRWVAGKWRKKRGRWIWVPGHWR